jgi:hypothetical protein
MLFHSTATMVVACQRALQASAALAVNGCVEYETSQSYVFKCSMHIIISDSGTV